MATEYRELPPGAALRQTVEALWVTTVRRESSAASAGLTVVPDGCMDLIYRLDSAGGGELLVSGPDLGPRTATVDTSVAYVGLRFRPAAARAVLGIEPLPLAGAGVVPAWSLSGRLARLEACLAGCGTAGALARRLHAQVEVLAGEATTAPRRPPRRVREAVARLRSLGPGEERVAAVARGLGVTTRTLHRELVAWTGLSPVLLARTFRFQAALARLRRESGGPLAALAAEAGYADQAHMAREFRALAGAPPSAFARSPIRSRRASGVRTR
jgi:AraC-like DNA-binding protein